MGPESTGMTLNETGIRWNSSIPAGMELESAGKTIFLQECDGIHRNGISLIKYLISRAPLI